MGNELFGCCLYAPVDDRACRQNVRAFFKLSFTIASMTQANLRVVLFPRAISDTYIMETSLH
jgi:hypothetical protein